MKPRALDLFCGAGGVTKGLQRAGFYVTGVDLYPQPNYIGDEFHQADAMTFPLEGFDMVWTSCPCQLDCAYRRRGNGVGDGYPDLIAPMRERLGAWSGPWVIENVEGARRKLRDPVRLCGTSFPSLEVRRHRLFESNVQLTVPACDHGRLTERKYPGSSNRPNGRTVCNVGEYRVPLWQQHAAMGIDWMTLAELSQAIPPAYAEHIGGQLMEVVMKHDEGWVNPARTTAKAMCSNSDCRSAPPHIILACTVDERGYCRECAMRSPVQGGGPLRAVQLGLGL